MNVYTFTEEQYNTLIGLVSSLEQQVEIQRRMINVHEELHKIDDAEIERLKSIIERAEKINEIQSNIITIQERRDGLLMKRNNTLEERMDRLLQLL